MILVPQDTVEPPIKDTTIKDTIEITSARFNVPNGYFPIVLIYS